MPTTFAMHHLPFSLLNKQERIVYELMLVNHEFADYFKQGKLNYIELTSKTNIGIYT